MNDSLDQWKLIVTDGPDIGRVFTITEQPALLIGRGSDSDTKIRDPRLSRIHCELLRQNNRWILIDRGGAGGTFIDGVMIDGPHQVSPDSVVRIGDSQLRFQKESMLDSPTVAPNSKPTDTPQEKAKPDFDQPNVAPSLRTTEITKLEGETFLRFRLDKMVSIGNNSVMFRAVDLKYDRLIAVKILKPQMTSTDEQCERFIRAMRTMLPVKHPNIVRTRKAGRTGPFCWAAFDWVDGISVAELIQQIGVSGMLDWKEVWRVAVHIGRALEEARKHNVVHRNVTPSNLLRRKDDQAFLLTDLIFARALEYTDIQQLTRPGDVVGDLGYMAPERIFDSTCVDGKSDQYSLGATLYTLLCGQPPYVAIGIADLAEQIRSNDPKPPPEFQMGLDERFCDVVMRMIRKPMEARFSSPSALLRELQHVGTLAGVDADWAEWN